MRYEKRKEYENKHRTVRQKGQGRGRKKITAFMRKNCCLVQEDNHCGCGKMVGPALMFLVKDVCNGVAGRIVIINDPAPNGFVFGILANLEFMVTELNH